MHGSLRFDFSSPGSNRTPHALQWAVRNAQRQEGGAEASAHGYVGTANIRRGGSGASASADINNGGNHLYSMPSALGRTFGIVVREVLSSKSYRFICE